MKTNRRKPFILATLALGLVLVMGLGANTFAKYYTKADGSDAARVAKWGVTASANADIAKTFGTGYVSDAWAESGNFEVKAGVDVVAPGTAGGTNASGKDITVAGTPEVAVKYVLTVTITDEALLDDVKGENQDYRPIVWTYAGTGIFASPTSVTGGTVADGKVNFANDSTQVVITYTAEVAPNTNLAGDVDLSWAWDFGTDAFGTTADVDTWDTAIGNAAVAGDLNLGVVYDLDIEQIDTYTPAP